MNDSAINYFFTAKELAVFRDMSENYLFKILQNSYVENFKRKQNIFIKNCDDLFYQLILKGSVKLYAFNERGEELIIEILENGNFINNLFTKKHQLNASALQDCVILKIPKSFLYKKLQENAIFTSNLLIEEAFKNQNLLGRIEQLSLANSEEKLGNFLLKQSLENGKKRNEFNLNLKKMTIASYLKIKPETLSRVLNKFKKAKVISVNSSKVKLTNSQNLCIYCDSVIASKCSDAKSSNCNYKI